MGIFKAIVSYAGIDLDTKDAFFDAVKSGDTKKVSKIIAKNPAAVGWIKEKVTEKDYWGKFGFLEKATLAFEVGKSGERIWEEGLGVGKSALGIACHKNDFDMVKLLVEKGADVNQIDRSENTPLYYAYYYGSKAMMVYLAEKGADPAPIKSDMEAFTFPPLALYDRDKMQNLSDLFAIANRKKAQPAVTPQKPKLPANQK